MFPCSSRRGSFRCETHDKFRQRAEHALRLPTARRLPKPHAIFELFHRRRLDLYLDYFNRGWLDFLGKSLEDVCGWRWTESVHPEDVAAIVQKWHAALASGEPFEIEARVRRADGSYRAFLHRKLPLRDEHGNIEI